MEHQRGTSCRARHDLDGAPGSVSAALDHTRAFLCRCSPALDQSATQDLLLVVSELVTNAVRHAPGPCTLALECDGGVQVAVSDHCSATPVSRPPDLAGGGGFGWHLVNQLSDRLEVHLDPPQGKTITAVLLRTP